MTSPHCDTRPQGQATDPAVVQGRCAGVIRGEIPAVHPGHRGGGPASDAVFLKGGRQLRACKVQQFVS